MDLIIAPLFLSALVLSIVVVITLAEKRHFVKSGIRKTLEFARARMNVLMVAAVAIAVFALVDVPVTVRVKALVISVLPLNLQDKQNAIMNLCQAAYAGRSDAIIDCFRAYN